MKFMTLEVDTGHAGDGEVQRHLDAGWRVVGISFSYRAQATTYIIVALVKEA